MKSSSAWKQLQFILMISAAAAIASPAQTFTNIASFDGSNGSQPVSIGQGADGNLWGTTSSGGQKNCGTVFKVTPAGALTVAFTFKCKHGNEPGGVTLGTDGNFYGTTYSGGIDDDGTVFKLTPRGSATVLLNFDGNDGSNPESTLTEGTDGNFYGVTHSGGTVNYEGTLFKITPTGTLTTLYDFDFTHGSQPFVAPIQVANGNFYGTTYTGGTFGLGTVYKITPTGSLKVLHDFGGSESDGSSPEGGLLQGADGNFYGTTAWGGPDNDGTVFKITPSGAFTTLHAFTGTDGGFPCGTLIQATDGNFYGTTGNGGTYGDGTIFQMTAKGTVTTLHSFDGADGIDPLNLIQNTNGTLYGFTYFSTSNKGTIYSLSMGFGSFVTFVRRSGEIGQVVGILGQGFTGATDVSFNGTPATFSVTSDTYLVADIPAGATTGFVKVTTLSGTFKSNVRFQIVR